MRWKSALFLALAGLSLSGCSAFVPSWNAQPTPIEIDNGTNSSDVNTPEVTEPDPEPVETEPEVEQPEPSPEDQEPVERESVTVEIMDAAVYEDTSRLEVVAQVPGLVESGGECSLKFLAGDFALERTSSAEDSSTYTACSIYVPASELPAGTAVVSVSYISATHEGVSESVSVVVP